MIDEEHSMKVPNPQDSYKPPTEKKLLNRLDDVMDRLTIPMKYELEDVYGLWNWHPGMG